MKITKDVVEYVAHLARLELKADEVELYTEQLDKLNSLDTTGVEPTSHVIPLTNVFRGDTIDYNFEPDQAVGNAPERKATFFKVPPVIEVD
jgi:aspartyl-tRNA(Asn)/glutamyl-tRNA(Gln) amidotransferase subunit C